MIPVCEMLEMSLVYNAVIKLLQKTWSDWTCIHNCSDKLHGLQCVSWTRGYTLGGYPASVAYRLAWDSNWISNLRNLCSIYLQNVSPIADKAFSLHLYKKHTPPENCWWSPTQLLTDRVHDRLNVAWTRLESQDRPQDPFCWNLEQIGFHPFLSSDHLRLGCNTTSFLLRRPFKVTSLGLEKTSLIRGRVLRSEIIVKTVWALGLPCTSLWYVPILSLDSTARSMLSHLPTSTILHPRQCWIGLAW